MNPISRSRTGILRRGASLIAVLFIILVIAGAFYYFRSRRTGHARHQGSGDSSAQEAVADLKPLEGEWIRPDSGVVLEISGVDRPGPISVWGSGPGNTSVSDASVRVVDGLLEVRMDFSDDSCSGCTYRLTYDDTGDRLIGSCQESGGGRRDVVFTRKQ